jgi:photosystem II stability/assembly factor-like uncharacterized protein
MKNRLLFPIIFAFIFSACSDFSGNEDEVEASLKPGPVAKQKKEAEEEEEEEATRTWYNLYGVTFGDNTFVAVGKTGAIRTSSDNGSSWDNGTSGTTYYFNEVAYGDSTFTAVGQSGRIYTSSDNGTTWSRATWDGSSAHLTGLAYGNNVSIAVSSSNVIKSTDNGSNWTLKSSAVEVYDMVYGNRAASGEVATVDTITHGGDHDNGTYTSVALSGGSGSGAQATVIVSGDNVTSVSITEGGTGLYQIGDVLTIDNATIGGDDNATCRVATVTVTSNVFIGVGAKGASCYSPDDSPYSNGEKWICNPPITNEKTLYGITYGNNKFITVGASGSVLRSDDGSDWDSSTSNTTGTLYSVAFGNSRFVAVGYNTVIVSTDDNGTSFTRTASYDFNDISFGNGIFVAVGDDENIHTSTDGDDWTKVYGK